MNEDLLILARLIAELFPETVRSEHAQALSQVARASTDRSARARALLVFQQALFDVQHALLPEASKDRFDVLWAAVFDAGAQPIPGSPLGFSALLSAHPLLREARALVAGAVANPRALVAQARVVAALAKVERAREELVGAFRVLGDVTEAEPIRAHITDVLFWIGCVRVAFNVARSGRASTLDRDPTPEEIMQALEVLRT